MPDTVTGGAVGLQSSASFAKNPAAIELPGSPQFLGCAAKAILTRDGEITVRLTAFASYGDREVSVAEDVDLGATEIDELLQALVGKHQERLGRRALRAAFQAWKIAVEHGEMEGDDMGDDE